jgi:hypothetical protein
VPSSAEAPAAGALPRVRVHALRVEPERPSRRSRDMSRFLVAAAVAAAAVVAVTGLALAANRGQGGSPAPGGPVDPTASSDVVTVKAPIDGIDVLIRESNPPQVTLKVTAGLPSGCARQHSYRLTRSGNTFNVTVLNSMPKGDPICTMIYGAYVLNIDLGGGFTPGTTYTVNVNDEVETFTT